MSIGSIGAWEHGSMGAWGDPDSRFFTQKDCVHTD